MTLLLVKFEIPQNPLFTLSRDLLAANVAFREEFLPFHRPDADLEGHRVQ